MDAEITADAHEVDEKGQTELLPLSPTLPLADSQPAFPRASSATASSRVPAEESSGEEEFADDESGAAGPGQLVSAVVDATATTLMLGQATGDTGPGPDPASVDALLQELLPLRWASAAAPANRSRRGSASGLLDGTTTPPRSRPLIRAFTSARDLAMSRSTPTSPQGSSQTLPRSSSCVHFETITSPLQFEAHTGPLARPLHARSSSHPDLRAVLEEYEATGPVHTTKVYSISGNSTPDGARSPPTNEPAGGGGLVWNKRRGL